MSITHSVQQRRIIRRVQQALRKNPYDTAALLQYAVMIANQPDQKRRLLHQVLSLEPANRSARQMLLEMDMAEIGGNPARLSLAVILTDRSLALPNPPLLLRYSLMHRLLVYAFMSFTVIFSLLNIRGAGSLTLSGALLVFLLLPLWYVSAVIELGDNGLNVSRLFGLIHSEITWSEVKEVRRTAIGQGVRIVYGNGKVVGVSAQVQGYPFILDILSQMRPDLLPQAKGAENTLPPPPPVPLTANEI